MMHGVKLFLHSLPYSALIGFHMSTKRKKVRECFRDIQSLPKLSSSNFTHNPNVENIRYRLEPLEQRPVHTLMRFWSRADGMEACPSGGMRMRWTCVICWDAQFLGQWFQGGVQIPMGGWCEGGQRMRWVACKWVTKTCEGGHRWLNGACKFLHIVWWMPTEARRENLYMGSAVEIGCAKVFYLGRHDQKIERSKWMPLS